MIDRGIRGHIVTTAIEHDSILGASLEVEKMGGKISRIRAGPDGRVSAEEVISAIREDTVLVSGKIVKWIFAFSKTSYARK